MATQSRTWLPIRDAAQRSGATEGQLRAALRRGRLHGRKMGEGKRGFWLVRLTDVQRYFAEEPPAGYARSPRGPREAE